MLWHAYRIESSILGVSRDVVAWCGQRDELSLFRLSFSLATTIWALRFQSASYN